MTRELGAALHRFERLLGVIAPVPGQPGAAPAGSYLTLTTCHPKFSAAQRLVVHAVLVGPPLSRAELPDGPAALAVGG